MKKLFISFIMLCLATSVMFNVCFASDVETTASSNEWTKTITVSDSNRIWKSDIKFKESFNVYLYYSYDEIKWVRAVPDEINELTSDKTVYLKVKTSYSTNINIVYSQLPFKGDNHSSKKSLVYKKPDVSRETVVILEDVREDLINIATMNGSNFVQTLMLEPYELTQTMKGNEISISIETTPFDGYVSDKEHPNIKLANDKVFSFVVE